MFGRHKSKIFQKLSAGDVVLLNCDKPQRLWDGKDDNSHFYMIIFGRCEIMSFSHEEVAFVCRTLA